jgi:formylglycine-generating enzyme
MRKIIIGSLISLGLAVALATSTKADENVNLKVDAGVKPACPEGMKRVSGWYCPEVEEICLHWLDADQSSTANSGIGPLRCGEFKYPTKCLSAKRKYLDFCMSEFEYPGVDTYPIVGIDYFQAKEIAKKDGNRLCTKEEFNFACEGEDIHPYGYGEGYSRDDGTTCNIDKPWIDYTKFPQSSWNNVDGGLYQGVKSDPNTKCRSWAGIANINGNVDEILDSEDSDGVVLSGGYWSVVRSRCRPKTEHVHNKWFSFYQVGMRECKDVDQ